MNKDSLRDMRRLFSELRTLSESPGSNGEDATDAPEDPFATCDLATGLVTLLVAMIGAAMNVAYRGWATSLVWRWHATPLGLPPADWTAFAALLLLLWGVAAMFRGNQGPPVTVQAVVDANLEGAIFTTYLLSTAWALSLFA